MAHFDKQQAIDFLTLLTGNQDEIVTFQLFYDPKDGTKRPDLASHFNAKLKQSIPTIERAERNLQGVYVCINETDGRGRYAQNISRIRTLFADFDGIEEPAWPLPPHFVTKRDDTHGHAYWLVEDVEVDEFMYLQRLIADCCGTDDQVIDPSRVARLPGTLHLKDPQNPKQYYVAQNNNLQGKYYKQHILDAFKLNQEQQAKYDQWRNSRIAITDGSGFEDDEYTVKNVAHWLKNNADPAVEGNGTHTLIRVISYAYDHGVQLETAQELAWEHYNPRCVPPWGEHERDHFDAVIERAYKYAKNEPGCRTATAAFKDADPIPPPPPKKVKLELVRTGDRIDKAGAAVMYPSASTKTEHYSLAQAFDGAVYDGVNLVRCNKMFYQFNGRSWELVDDTIIKSSIQRFYSNLKPSDSLTRGVYNCFCDLVNVKMVENGIWLDSGKPVGDVVCFKNGLVDLSNNKAVVMEHNPNYFCFNELQYDYEPTATCPQWLAFINDVFEHDPKLIDQLQEWFGYCMTSDNAMQKFALLFGVSRGGKGVITDTLANVVGWDNTCAPSLSKLTSDSALASMAHSSLALIPDAHSVHTSKRDDVLSNFKAITGNDPMSYHVLYKGSETSTFKTRFVLSTNNMPEFIDASGALVNRMLAFTFVKSFKDKEDVTLKDRLRTEVAGIAQWALRGLQRLRQQGYFTEAPAGKQAKEQIQDDMNPISDFLDRMCVFKEGEFSTTLEIVRSYKLYCTQNMIDHPLSNKKLIQHIKNANLDGIEYDRQRTEQGRLYGFENLALNLGFSSPD